MTEPIRIFVGTDERMGKAELALEASVRHHTSAEVEFTWMRLGNGLEFEGWDIGRDPGHPYSGEGWATDFTNFRWAVPDLADFEGTAIYMDADMVALGDINELVLSLSDHALCAWPGEGKHGRPDLIVFNCSHRFWLQTTWPSIGDMKINGWPYHKYRDLIISLHNRCVLPPEWDCLDGKGLSANTKLIHFTNMRTQPWRPWPDVFDYDKYGPHRCQEAVDIFWHWHKQGLEMQNAAGVD